jgi:hypothetical protein
VSLILPRLAWKGMDVVNKSCYPQERQASARREAAEKIARFNALDSPGLSASMPPRAITLCEDETFHPQICLVAIEPVSNFILVEQYQPKRDTKTWQECTSAKLAVLPKRFGKYGLTIHLDKTRLVPVPSPRPPRGTECVNRARSGLWEPRAGNRPGASRSFFHPLPHISRSIDGPVPLLPPDLRKEALVRPPLDEGYWIPMAFHPRW